MTNQNNGNHDHSKEHEDVEEILDELLRHCDELERKLADALEKAGYKTEGDADNK